MFVNFLWSLLALAILVGVYIIIRIKHGEPLLDAYANVDGFFARWWARIVAFRSWVIGAIAGLAVSLPDLLVQIVPGLDLTWLVGENWSKIVLGALSTFLLINTAFKTRPDGQKAA